MGSGRGRLLVMDRPHRQRRPVIGFSHPIGPGEVTSEELADGSVTTPKVADTAITTPKVGDGAVTTPKVGDLAITTPKVGDEAVTTPKVPAPANAEGIVSGVQQDFNAIDPSYQPIRARRDVQNFVWLEGVVRVKLALATGASLVILPVGFRPAMKHAFFTWVCVDFGFLIVEPDGGVRAYTKSGGALTVGTEVYLSPVHFQV